ncbi:hemoglobin subunit beta isoform X1 [Salvelinus sp. IW2-2015]|uniref:hemoglobin subunit beta isoform X1 n=1 Tax=Salvelinus sp. IW2-2015 TaxID=2691554 RepID=UPI0038D43B3E
MVQWTDFERQTIQSIFGKMDYDDVGPAALSRCLIVYPWTQRYFGNFGNLSNAAAIQGNPKVAAHGKTVLQGLVRAVKNMDDIKATYTELSVLHSDKLRVDPDNFRVNELSFYTSQGHILLSIVCPNAFFYMSICSFLLQLLADCLTIVVAARMGAAFTADVQGAFQKFLAIVVCSLCRQYH